MVKYVYVIFIVSSIYYSHCLRVSSGKLKHVSLPIVNKSTRNVLFLFALSLCPSEKFLAGPCVFVTVNFSLSFRFRFERIKQYSAQTITCTLFSRHFFPSSYVIVCDFRGKLHTSWICEFSLLLDILHIIDHQFECFDIFANTLISSFHITTSNVFIFRSFEQKKAKNGERQ